MTIKPEILHEVFRRAYIRQELHEVDQGITA
jgi:hypothetical protein